MRPEDPLLSETELAKYLGLSLSTTRRMRYAGTGPPVSWLGRRPFYRKSAVDRWVNEGGTKRKGVGREP
jgi:predicted DNA-binding transcriptional regulator AlpA